MRALLQRVTQASVRVDDETIASIGPGLVALVGVAKGDTDEDVRYLADKTANLRIFPDAEGRFNRSVIDISGEVLVVSQFTLLAETRRGRRPSFTEAAPPEEAEPLIERFKQLLAESGINVQSGWFQQHMLVELSNDGPVTILIDSRDRHIPRRAT